MIVATIFLSADNCYVDAEGNLPEGRTTWDKQLLSAVCKGESISQEAAALLPPSITRVVSHITNEVEPTVGITIKEINGLTDLLIVTRSDMAVMNGKKFRLDNFELIVAQGQLEIWRRK